MSVLEKLTEGIVNRDLKKEGEALLNKWEATGLLEGIGDDRERHSMSRLLENQAKELLRESVSMSAGDVEGFAAVAFPIVRRVFGSLIANDLVSVQPMSLPSGLIFFLDFTFPVDKGAAGAVSGLSIYGGANPGQQITGGIGLDDTEVNGNNNLNIARQDTGFYNLGGFYASPTGSSSAITIEWVASGTAGRDYTGDALTNPVSWEDNYTDLGKLTQFDPDLSGTNVAVLKVATSAFTQLNKNALHSIHITGATTQPGVLLRRLTQFDPVSGSQDDIIMVMAATGTESPGYLASFAGIEGGDTSRTGQFTFTHAITDAFEAAGPVEDKIGAVAGTTTWGLENQTEIPEIDIKVDSVSITALTKKLKAKWTPELGQDLNAYHNLDAEVELTSILSEQIALEIDREILGDLVNGAKAGRYYWSRSPGMFLRRDTGAEVGATSSAPDFTGTVSEWYETLIETINDVSAAIHRKVLRGGANFVVCSPEVANILEFTAGFRGSVTHDDDRGTAGTVKVGALSKRYDVYVDPYFPRNVVLVGRNGGSFLESGYVYAPYVPLQVTPTIFGVEDFVPRKGVMTRYAKKMVRPDFYGVVIVRGLLGESGL